MNTKTAKSLTIQTPEGVAFSLNLAGPVARALACSIDFCAKIVLFQVIQVPLHFFYLVGEDLFTAVNILTYFVISIGYSIVCEWLWQGQTLGKRLFRLRVMDRQGLHIHFSQIVIRNLVRAVDALPTCYFIGGLSSLISNKAQRLGDIAANTIVVRHTKVFEPDINQLLKDKYNSLRLYPHLCARLRQNVTIHEAELAMQAVMRRDEFEPQARVALFQDMAAYFKPIVKFPAEAIDGVSDEQYIKNVVDVLFRNK